LTHPSVYDLIRDDFAPDPEEFTPNDHPDIWYVAVNSTFAFVGMFSLIPENAICWQVHVVMFPWARTHERWASARELVPWLAKNTDCMRLTAAVPAHNQRAIVYGTHGLGMHYVGRQEKAFLKDGVLRDLVLLGRAIGG
jgi:hypothetical protein